LKPEFSIPLFNLQQPIEVSPKSEADTKTGAHGLPDLKVVLDSPALAGGAQSNDTKLLDATDQRSALQQKQALAAAANHGKSQDAGDNATAIDRLVNAGAMPGKENAVRMPAVPASLAAPKRPATDASRETHSTDPKAGTPVPTQATSSGQPTRPVNAGITNSVPNAVAAVAAVPAASQLEQASAASAKAILDSAMAAKATQQSSSIKSGLATDSRNLAVQPAPGGPAKTVDSGNKNQEIRGQQIKDREIKDRGLKDSKIESAQTGKFAAAQANSVSDGLAKPAAATIKEVSAVAASAHSDAHARQEPVKQSGGMQSAQSMVTDMDAPDEAVPTAAPSPVNAKFVQGLSQSEFRVGMQSQEFGSIDIRTSVARHMFSAQISVEHGDFAKSMTADLPALYHRLADQQVSVANIVIQGQHLATSSGLAQDSQPQKWQSHSNTVSKSEAQPMLPVVAEAIETAGRLDIRI
jgi:flagellar hook-length control protein FliK